MPVDLKKFTIEQRNLCDKKSVSISIDLLCITSREDQRIDQYICLLGGARTQISRLIEQLEDMKGTNNG